MRLMAYSSALGLSMSGEWRLVDGPAPTGHGLADHPAATPVSLLLCFIKCVDATVVCCADHHPVMAAFILRSREYVREQVRAVRCFGHSIRLWCL